MTSVICSCFDHIDLFLSQCLSVNLNSVHAYFHLFFHKLDHNTALNVCPLEKVIGLSGEENIKPKVFFLKNQAQIILTIPVNFRKVGKLMYSKIVLN